MHLSQSKNQVAQSIYLREDDDDDEDDDDAESDSGFSAVGALSCA